MKKLFLYLAIISILFLVPYSITSLVFKHIVICDNSLNSVKCMAENDYFKKTPIRSTTNKDILANNNKANQNEIPASEYNLEEAVNLTKEQDNHKYIVSEENGYVIVFCDDESNVYEYTNIQTDMLKKHSPIEYNRIKEKTIFDSKEQLYKFLQSISS